MTDPRKSAEEEVRAEALVAGEGFAANNLRLTPLGPGWCESRSDFAHGYLAGHAAAEIADEEGL